MAETITVPEHLTTEFKHWLAYFGLNVVEHVGTEPTRYELGSFGGGDAGLREVRAGDTIAWDGQTKRLSVIRPNRAIVPVEAQVMAVAGERGCLYEVASRYLAEDPESAALQVAEIGPTVKDLASRGLIELRDTPDGDWDTGLPLTGGDLHTALVDPAALIGSIESVRLIMLRLASDDH